MSESSITDSKVLQQTTYSPPDSKGRVQLQFVLPSGRKVTSSDWLVPGEIKGKVLIAWANAIRAEDAFDIQERHERETLARAEKRALAANSAARAASDAPASQSNSPGSPSQATSSAQPFSPSSTTSLPDDPADMLYAKLQNLRTERERVADQLLQLQIRLDTIQRNISRWEVVANGLGLPSEKPSSEPRREDPPATDLDRGHSARPDPERPARTARARRAQRGAARKGQPPVRPVQGSAGAQAGADVALPRGRSDADVRESADDRARFDSRPEVADGSAAVAQAQTRIGNGDRGTTVPGETS